jgi:4-aminobutyrate aminotransferase/(S)-3-amino-2-methylpropionate transaminase
MTAVSTHDTTGIRLVTEVPGPASQALLARRSAAVPGGVAHATPLAIRRGQGALVEDVDGNWFIDFAGGIGVMNVGYGDPEIERAIAEQSRAFTHSCFQVVSHEPYIALAEELNRRTPGTHTKKTLLLNSGAEAVENAVKIARAATGRPAIIAFEHGFHGRTMLTMTLTSKVAYKQGFGPFAPEVYRAPYPFCFRCPWNREVASCGVPCGDHLEAMFKTHVDPKSVAAVIVEPVLGEGGFTAPPRDFFHKLRALCDRHGILLIADEIQSGMARTGRLYACEHVDLVPDLILTAKSVAGGLPLSAVTGRAEVMDAAAPGGLGSTFGGNAVACAAALASLRRIDELGLCERALAIGETVRTRFERLQQEVPAIADIRGLGAMVGIEFMRSPGEPAQAEVAALQREAYQHGVLTVTAGTHANVLRTLMPLVITDAQLAEGLSVLEAAIRKVFAA